MFNKNLVLSYWCKDKDMKESLESYLFVMEALCTASMVLPAISASTGFFKTMHNISLPFSNLTNEEGQEMRSIYSMKPCQAGIQSALATLIKTYFNIAEQHYRVNPTTVLSAISLAGFEAIEQSMKDLCNVHKKAC